MSTFEILPKAKVYVYGEPISMVCSFPKLSKLVTEQLGKKVVLGNMFFFINKKRTYVKILFWSMGGVCILAKKLKQGVFNVELNHTRISIDGLHSVLDKPDVKRIKER